MTHVDLELLKQVNSLWKKIYPYLAYQIFESYGRTTGSILELGPFSGGIATELLNHYPELDVTVAAEHYILNNYLENELSIHSKKIRLQESRFNPIDFCDSSFDLVIIRGVYFFMDPDGNLVREIIRVLKPCGTGFIGGGYGKGTPSELINEISEESRDLNEKLGRKIITIDELIKIIARSGHKNNCDIIEDGGLWVRISKNP